MNSQAKVANLRRAMESTRVPDLTGAAKSTGATRITVLLFLQAGNFINFNTSLGSVGRF